MPEPAEVRSSARRKAARFHPDKSTRDIEMFRRIIAARDELEKAHGKAPKYEDSVTHADVLLLLLADVPLLGNLLLLRLATVLA